MGHIDIHMETWCVRGLSSTVVLGHSPHILAAGSSSPVTRSSLGQDEQQPSPPPRLSSSPSAAPLEDDDLLFEILLRLPPLPSSLPRASAVCKRWRSLASDPAFSRRFRHHHRRNCPLLGFFHRGTHGLYFFPTLEAPNRIPPGRFSLQFYNHFRLLGCRHGLVLIFDEKLLQSLVWDPVTSQQHRLAIPLALDPTKDNVNGAVLRSAVGDVQHFKVVLVVADNNGELNKRMLACVYSSETGVWSDLISTPNPSEVDAFMPAVLVENSLYWLFDVDNVGKILEFDLERQSLAMVQMPFDMSQLDGDNFTVMRAEGGGLGLLFVPYFTTEAQLWKRKTDCDGVVSWGLTRSIELDKLLSLNLKKNISLYILGYAEDNNVLLLWTIFGIFTVQLESLQFKKHPRTNGSNNYLPFESVYAAGPGIGVGHGAELLHNT